MRLIYRSFQQYVHESEITTGVNVGNRVFIPRIALTNDASMNSIEFERKQFLVRLPFTMTINRAQGQTFDSVDLYLLVSVFTHGQLYVAMSRVRTPSGIEILAGGYDSNAAAYDIDVYTVNIVHSEFLRQ
jgi:ATP-dependent DNA helicase PIF1